MQLNTDSKVHLFLRIRNTTRKMIILNKNNGNENKVSNV